MQTLIPFSPETLEEMLVTSVEKLFSTMLSSQATFNHSVGGEINSESSDTPFNTGKPMIVSMVGFIGVANGVVYIYMEEDLAKDLTCDFLGMEQEEFAIFDADEKQETINDALGELANMIVGNFKNMWCDEGYQCKLTIPSIVRGRNFAIETTSSVLRHAYHFDVAGSTLVADLILKAGE